MYKFLSKFCLLLALILSHLMCIVVTYKYAEHIFNRPNTPANVVFLYAIPFLILMIALFAISISYKIKAKKQAKEKMDLPPEQVQ